VGRAAVFETVRAEDGQDPLENLRRFGIVFPRGEVEPRVVEERPIVGETPGQCLRRAAALSILGTRTVRSPSSECTARSVVVLTTARILEPPV
jgi:hypothetical protein